MKTAARVHMLAGLEPVGRQGKVKAWCVCAWGTTARVSENRALDALVNEHGWSDPVCSRCGRNRDDEYWPSARDSYKHLLLMVGDEPVTDPLGKVLAAVRDDELWLAWRGQEQRLVCADDMEACLRIADSLEHRRLAEANGLDTPPTLKLIPGGGPR